MVVSLNKMNFCQENDIVTMYESKHLSAVFVFTVRPLPLIKLGVSCWEAVRPCVNNWRLSRPCTPIFWTSLRQLSYYKWGSILVLYQSPSCSLTASLRTTSAKMNSYSEIIKGLPVYFALVEINKLCCLEHLWHGEWLNVFNKWSRVSCVTIVNINLLRVL